MEEQVSRVMGGGDYSVASMKPIFDQFYEGVIIADKDGVIQYLNATQIKTDDLKPGQGIGRKVTDFYHVDEGFSPTMQCLKIGRPVNNLACYYRTRLGRMVNSVHNVFPLVHGGRITGAICFVREYNALDHSLPEPMRDSRPENLQVFKPVDDQVRKEMGKNGTRFRFTDIIGETPSFQAAVKSAHMAALTPSPIMLCGETGTGKELFAQSIHNHSRRRYQPYVAVNCAAIPENLLEGILFGTSKGAFTGAMDKPGLFEKASGGTLLLDEINSLPLGLQAKLLRVLQENKVRRVGSLREIEVDLKLISSTNEDLRAACKEGRFRLDLLYRLGVVFIEIPPLRDRIEDLGLLVEHFLLRFSKRMGKSVDAVTQEVLDLFRAYPWPGNVRELEHIIEGAMNMVTHESWICRDHLRVHVGDFFDSADENAPWAAQQPAEEEPPQDAAPPRPRASASIAESGKSLSQIQVDHEVESIKHALWAAQGVCAQAARHLGISPQLFHYKLKKYKIDRLVYRRGGKDRA